MSYEDLRREQQDREQQNLESSYEYEEQVCPTLLSGLKETIGRHGDKSRLSFSVSMKRGVFLVLLNDRRDHLKSWLEVGSLENLEASIERAICDGNLVWSPDYYSQQNP